MNTFLCVWACASSGISNYNCFFIADNYIWFFFNSQCKTAAFYRFSNWFDLEQVILILLTSFFHFLIILFFRCCCCIVFKLKFHNKIPAKAKRILTVLLILQYLYISGGKHWGCTRSQHNVYCLTELSLMPCKSLLKSTNWNKWLLKLETQHFLLNNVTVTTGDVLLFSASLHSRSLFTGCPVRKKSQSDRQLLWYSLGNLAGRRWTLSCYRRPHLDIVE